MVEELCDLAYRKGFVNVHPGRYLIVQVGRRGHERRCIGMNNRGHSRTGCILLERVLGHERRRRIWRRGVACVGALQHLGEESLLVFLNEGTSDFYHGAVCVKHTRMRRLVVLDGRHGVRRCRRRFASVQRQLIKLIGTQTTAHELSHPLQHRHIHKIRGSGPHARLC